MIPPEPGPDPPEPTVPEYTYATSSEISLGSVTGVLYTDIQSNGTNCMLSTTEGPPSNPQILIYPSIVLYEDVLGDEQCYFVRGSAANLIGFLGSNAGVGLTVPTYWIHSGQVTSQGEAYINSSSPSDYFDNVVARNFTLTQRS